MDVKNNFLNGDLTKEVYMKPHRVILILHCKFVNFVMLYMDLSRFLVLGLQSLVLLLGLLVLSSALLILVYSFVK